jgi:integrase/recombinase XerD
MKVSVYLNDSYVNSENQSKLYLRVFVDGKYLKIPLNIYCSSSDFDKEKFIINNGTNKKTNNLLIKQAIGKASDIILKYNVNNKPLSRELFEKEYSRPSVIYNFYDFMAEQIKIRTGSDLTESSSRQHLSTLEKLKKFKPELMMVDIDEEFVRNFKKYLSNNLKNNKNTVYNTLKNFRTYINLAITKELLEQSPFKSVKLKKTEVYPEFLTEEELNGLWNLYHRKFLPDRYQNVLRWYLFGCCTGLRIGDLRNAKHEMIDNNTLSFKPIKTLNTTNKTVNIPLTSKALALIADEKTGRNRGHLFNCISEQRMNLYLKDLVKESTPKITKEISFHSARHTFATMFLKKIKQANGILILQRILGHAKLDSTMIYSHVLNDDIKQAMREFDN